MIRLVGASFPTGMLESAFQLDSVVPAGSPGAETVDCYRYVISQGGPHTDNAITGIRYGSLAEVNIQLRDMVDRLNERLGKQRKKF